MVKATWIEPGPPLSLDGAKILQVFLDQDEPRGTDGFYALDLVTFTGLISGVVYAELFTLEQIGVLTSAWQGPTEKFNGAACIDSRRADSRTPVATCRKPKRRP